MGRFFVIIMFVVVKSCALVYGKSGAFNSVCKGEIDIVNGIVAGIVFCNYLRFAYVGIVDNAAAIYLYLGFGQNFRLGTGDESLFYGLISRVGEFVGKHYLATRKGEAALYGGKSVALVCSCDIK